MGVSCCVRETNKHEDLDNCHSISDLRDFLSFKLDLAELEQEEIQFYLNDKNKLPTTIEVKGLSEQDLQKRKLYLNEIKECINNVDEILKNNKLLNVIDIRNALKEFNEMYSYIYDDSKRYKKWFTVFKEFTGSCQSKNKLEEK